MQRGWIWLCCDAAQTSPQCLPQRFVPSVYLAPPLPYVPHRLFSFRDEVQLRWCSKSLVFVVVVEYFILRQSCEWEVLVHFQHCNVIKMERKVWCYSRQKSEDESEWDLIINSPYSVKSTEHSQHFLLVCLTDFLFYLYTAQQQRHFLASELRYRKELVFDTFFSLHPDSPKNVHSNVYY